jgi:hypothetical protein
VSAPRTVAEAYGPDIANRLAMWAIDALFEPPTTITTFSTKMPAHVIERGRAILDEAGLDWRALKIERDGGNSAHSQRRADG